MIDDVMNIVGLEFVKDRNDDGSVCDGGQESNAPMRTVAASDVYKRQFITFLDAAQFKNNM